MDSNNETFTRLFMQNQHALKRFIRAMVPNASDAEDVLQETAVVLWQKQPEYDPSRPFFPWAMQFARNKIYQFRRHHARDRLILDDDVFGLLLAERPSLEPQLDRRRHWLDTCFKKLPGHSAGLMERRYFDGMTVQEIAAETQTSVSTLYKLFYRIRDALMRCVENSLVQEVEP
ncbi:MAG: sigma-70 family RNA polymerase sigma factor [Verrucomicrobiota bacterium]